MTHWMIRALQALLSVLAFLASAAAEARTLYVANTGVDSAACGQPRNPCRSISRAIANAVPRDTIMVGPGSMATSTATASWATPARRRGSRIAAA